MLTIAEQLAGLTEEIRQAEIIGDEMLVDRLLAEKQHIIDEIRKQQIKEVNA